MNAKQLVTTGTGMQDASWKRKDLSAMETPLTSTSKTEYESRWNLSAIWEWIKHFFTIESPAKRDHLAMAIELLAKQHETLDKIVSAKFDMPVHSAVTEQRVTQPMFPPSMMSDVLTDSSDEEFLQATNGEAN